MIKRREYAIYKGEKELFVGTAKECALHFGVRVETIYNWAAPSNIRFADTGVRAGRKPRKKECSGVKVAVRLWGE